MQLSKEDFSILQSMQRLCVQVEDDAITIQTFIKSLRTMERRRKELQAYYEKEWIRVVDSNSISGEQQKQLEKELPKGRYSILGQDTIWNALTDVHESHTRLLKAIAKII